MVKDKERLFKKEYAFELHGIANGDLESAKGLAQIKAGRLENIVYLVQQSIEKSIKTVLCFKQISYPLVHDIGILIAKLPSDLMPPHGYQLNEFNQFAAVRRYEEAKTILENEDIETAIKIGEEVLSWAKKVLKSD